MTANGHKVSFWCNVNVKSDCGDGTTLKVCKAHKIVHLNEYYIYDVKTKPPKSIKHFLK